MKFEVGQRVRVILIGSRRYGEVTTVLRAGVEGEQSGKRFIGYEVDLPCRTHPAYKYCVFLESSLEAIDDGHDKITWDEFAKNVPDLGWHPMERVDEAK